MSRRIKGILPFMLFLVPVLVFAQTPRDTIRLDEVEVRANFPVNNMGFKRVKLDSTILTPRSDANLGTILSQYSTIFIKTYGSNTLASPSFRGTGAHHTQVEWNGININSPMLGQADLSQFPVSQFDNIEILYGAAGLTRNSGAFGGIVNLTSTPDWNNRITVNLSQTVASFNNFTTNLSAMAGNRNVQSHTRFNLGTGKNNFPYYNDISGTNERMINNAYNQFGLSEDLYVKFKDKHLLTARIWYNYTNRDIPPLTTDTDDEHNENQTDEALRSIVEYRFIVRSFSLAATTALIQSTMHYVNDSLNNTHTYYSLANRIRGNYSGWKHVTISPGIDFTHDWVYSEAYAENKQRQVVGGFLEMIYQPGSLFTLSLLARAEVTDGLLMPFIPAIGIEIKPVKKWNLSISMNVSKNYRYPSLNDLYWENWGNPDLKPEMSYAGEGSLTWNRTSASRHFFIEAEVTGYITLLDDMIVWSPSAESSAIWHPENIDQVLSRGVEAGLNMNAVFWKSKLGINIAYNFCKATYQKDSHPFGNSIGKQLFYTPENTVNAVLRFSRSGFYFSYIFNYTGRRYLGKDNIAYMPGYNLSNIFFGKNVHLNDFILSLQLEINNLFDLDYQSIANRPMPGINYGITIKGQFGRKSDQ